MKTSVWAKIFGWVQFGLAFLGQVGQSGGFPHSIWQWVALGGSAAIAAATHAASSTDGTK